MSKEPPATPEALLAAAAADPAARDSAPADGDSTSSSTVGLLPVAPESTRKLRAMDPTADAGLPPFAGTVPLREISLPNTGGVLGIPEIVLAAYRNAELAMESAMPGCGLRWNLLAGIGRIESAHASGGRTDAAGTTVNPIFGPALDGTLPGNEIIKAADGSYVRAIGPMQFLPSTWSRYAADGNGDGVADPHNVFDAALAAGKYLCSGGMNLADPQQELRAVLRYNNSMAYAADVLSWSNAYRTGGAPRQVTISPELIPPGSAPVLAAPPDQDMTAVDTDAPTATKAPQHPSELPPGTTVTPGPSPEQTFINIPGLPPIPCGIFCPPPAPDPCERVAVPAPMPDPVLPARPLTGFEFGQPRTEPAERAAGPDPACATPDERTAAEDPAAPAEPQQTPAAPPAPEPAPEPQVATTPEPEPAPAPAEPTPPPAPAITLPFGITIPLPAPAPVPPQG
ncbi:MAG TPA: lytic murein transglycosylase [Nocardia sp.]|uniref:lytic transglycosylase domain-containing protein n=1 Tax=Nocardia sp. TaxID=1821 RepID=UPI002B4AD6DD|nr:lytic murein transglycosylase [Nocardia sp.]HLS76261.1 lytic murein transglycosylase [Nocardia sp.]